MHITICIEIGAYKIICTRIGAYKIYAPILVHIKKDIKGEVMRAVDHFQDGFYV